MCANRVEEERDALRTFFGCNQCTPSSSHQRYQPLKIVGSGSYGTVCSAVDKCADPSESTLVAIKKISNVFASVPEALRIYREIVFLRAMSNVHPDIVKVRDVLMPCNTLGYRDVFIVFDLMDASLQTVIERHHDKLSEENVRVFMYQLLRSIAFLHHAGIMHRDLKPANILVDAHNGPSLKLCDFGLARSHIPTRRSKRVQAQQTRVQLLKSVAPTEGLHMWTDYVATRWYRAPELCGCFFSGYSTSVDMWSVGCIFAEMVLGHPILQGSSVRNQLMQIVQFLGKPSESDVNSIDNPQSRGFVRAVGEKVQSAGFDKLFENVRCPDLLDLLRKLLSFQAVDRPSARKALEHPFFEGFPHGLTPELQTAAEDVRTKIAYVSAMDESDQTEYDMRSLVFQEIVNWRIEKMKPLV